VEPDSSEKDISPKLKTRSLQKLVDGKVVKSWGEKVGEYQQWYF